MNKRRFIAAVLAALLAAAPAGAFANQENKNDDENEQRDGQSRHEGKLLNHVPLVLSNRDTLRVAAIVMMTQQLTYLSLATLGVDVTSQNRVGLGGLGVLGSLFEKTYDPDDFSAANDAGTVFFDGEDKLVVALKDDLKLSDFKVVIFNADNEYELRGTPKIEQVPSQSLAILGTVPIMNQVLLHTAPPGATALLGDLSSDSAADTTALQNLGVGMLEQIPVLRRHIIGRAYRGPDNTLLMVVRPALVVGDEDY